jgi:hypothetical protein
MEINRKDKVKQELVIWLGFVKAKRADRTAFSYSINLQINWNVSVP